MDYYGLDPCHYFSSPGSSWNAMLKMTKIELELISDIDMHLFIEKGKGRGISYIAKRHSKANNKYMECCDRSKKSKYITYLDANNLYRWAMSHYLPYSRLKWLNEKEIIDFCLDSISENSSIGYILEVDVKYPCELHGLHIDYPLASEKFVISKKSKYITYLDANNLYRWAVSHYLPYSRLKWLNEKEIIDFCLDSISENSSIGYILEVDDKYPCELHGLHIDYPLASEKFVISQNTLSNYCSNIANGYGIKIGGANKLVPNLRNKSKYVVH